MSAFVTILAGMTGAFFGFGCFGSAFWANIHKDGHGTATAIDIAAAILPLTLAFTLPGLIVAAVAFANPKYDTARTAFGAAAITFEVMAYPVLLATTAVLTVGTSIRHRRPKLPRADVVGVATGLAVVLLAILVEGART